MDLGRRRLHPLVGDLKWQKGVGELKNAIKNASVNADPE